MSRIDILTAVEREEFDTPQTFTVPQQQHYFDAPLVVVRLLMRLKTRTRQVYFPVSYGYFLATYRFYSVPRFRDANIQDVTRALGWSLKQLQRPAYMKQTKARHRQLIRTLCQFLACERAVRDKLITEIRELPQHHWHPRHIFLRVVKRLAAEPH